MSGYSEFKRDIAPLVKIAVVLGTIIWAVFLIWLALIIGDYLIDALRNVDWWKVAAKAGQFALVIGGLTAAIIWGKKR